MHKHMTCIHIVINLLISQAKICIVSYPICMFCPTEFLNVDRSISSQRPFNEDFRSWSFDKGWRQECSCHLTPILYWLSNGSVWALYECGPTSNWKPPNKQLCTAALDYIIYFLDTSEEEDLKSVEKAVI